MVLAVEGEEGGPTVKIAMQLPPGMANLKPATTPGWQANLGASVITWTGGRIPQGETGEFEIAGQFPRSPGKTLKFPVVQTYADGTVVRRQLPSERAWLADLGEQLDRLGDDWDELVSDDDALTTLVVEVAPDR